MPHYHPAKLQRVRVFISSPSDLRGERSAVNSVIEQLRSPGRTPERLGFDPIALDWSKHVAPMAGNPQTEILRQLDMSSWDIFIGMLWLRFGSPTGNINERTGIVYGSGTEQEFILAYDSWKKQGRPTVLAYRCIRPPLDMHGFDFRQSQAVDDFFKEFRPDGKYPALYKEFKEVNELESMVTQDLESALNEMSVVRQRQSRSKTPPRQRAVTKRSLTNDQLANRLRTRYGSNTICIVGDREDFDRFTADALLSQIREIESVYSQQTEAARRPVRVGVVCGPMTFRIIEFLVGQVSSDRWSARAGIRFVAMNRAAARDAFELSANYLVTYFSQSIPGACAIAYTSNPYDIEDINENRRAVDILLCSAGVHPGTPPNYLKIWHDALTVYQPSTPNLPQDCIGDFCLTPIDMSGRATYTEGLKKLIIESIDPYPQFRRLSDLLKIAHRPRIVVPLNTEERVPTGKEAVAHAVLRSGVANVCILKRQLAESLDEAVGGFILQRLTCDPDPDCPIRKWEAYSFRDGVERTVFVRDPRGRLDSRCKSPTRLKLGQFADRIPDLIVSELNDEAREYDWEAGEGVFYVRDSRKAVPFRVNHGVRKPGVWSLVLYQLVSRYVRQLARNGERRDQYIWDVGCGCGVVGILTARAEFASVGTVAFSDLDPRACDCARKNVEYLTPRLKAEYALGSLLEPFPDKLFDVIAFAPPFLPERETEGLDLNDSGGSNGDELAQAFCRELRDHLRPGGFGIIGVADYVDTGIVKEQLELDFGSCAVSVEQRTILYPVVPDGYPAAYETFFGPAAEARTGYHFERLNLDGCEFVAFEMRHYIVHRA